MMKDMQGVDIEIIGKPGGFRNNALIKPISVKINGVETLLPEGAEIHIDGELSRGAITVTLTMLARSISIKPGELPHG